MKKTIISLITTSLMATALFVITSIPAAHAVMDDNQGRFMIRGRLLTVLPDESSNITPIGGEVELSSSVVPEVDFSYFFTNNIAVELIAGVTPHDVDVKNSAVGDVDAGDVWLLPPTLTLQYHFTNLPYAKPYVGAGVNYTRFFNADSGTLDNVNYNSSFGPALQLGVDVPINDSWFVNLDVKKIWIDTTAKFNDKTINANVDVDPWIVGVGVGYRF